MAKSLAEGVSAAKWQSQIMRARSFCCSVYNLNALSTTSLHFAWEMSLNHVTHWALGQRSNVSFQSTQVMSFRSST